MNGRLTSCLGILLGAILYLNVPSAQAQEITPIPIPTPVIINYDLAYPGILPDNPFYKLKVLRDKIIATSIFDPLKKMDFYMLQADKGILAAAMLIDKNKIDLAGTTALKAEHNFTLITPQLYLLEQKPSQTVFKKLETSALKHQEVLNSLIKRVPADKQKAFLQVIDFSKRNLNTILIYKNQ